MIRLIVSAGLLISTLHAQSAKVAPAFDVASVKLTSHGRNAEGLSISDLKIAGPGRVIGTNASIEECILWAYEVRKNQVAGPDWLNSDAASYDIEAKAPPDTPPAQIRLMMQTLLAERFKLALHRENRELPAYFIVVAKNGLKLQQADPDARGGVTSRGGSSGVKVTSEKIAMAGLANRLSLDLGRPVFDKTGLAGFFRITLEWAREGDGPSIFTAMQEQLGLKLDAAKASIETLVIDHAQRIPTEN